MPFHAPQPLCDLPQTGYSPLLTFLLEVFQNHQTLCAESLKFSSMSSLILFIKCQVIVL